MRLRERVAVLLFHMRPTEASAEDICHLQRAVVVVSADVLAAGGDLLELHGLITNRFGDGGYVRNSEALRHILLALESPH
jgi:hypothetical protein